MSNTENGKWTKGAEKAADAADKTAEIAKKVAAGAGATAIFIKTILELSKK